MNAAESPWLEPMVPLADPPSAGLQQVNLYLKSLVETLELEAAGLKLFNFAGRRNFFLCWPSGDRDGQSYSAADLQVLNSRTPRCEPGRISAPLASGRRLFGLLWLRFPDQSRPPQGAMGELPALVTQTAELLDRSERQAALQAIQLADLCRSMHRADSLNELSRALCRGLYRFSRTIGVVLRPVYAETVLGKCFVTIVPGCRRWQGLIRRLDERYAPELLTADPLPISRQLGNEADFPAGVAPSLSLLPLRHEGRMVGTLTLWGGRPGDEDGKDPFRETFLRELGEATGQVLSQLGFRERYESLAEEGERKFRETMALFRISRAMHGSVRLNDLAHLLLSAAVVPEGGGFGRAQLFMLNERSGVFQGMLAVTSSEGALIFPEGRGTSVWEHPQLNPQIMEAQRTSAATRNLVRQRLAMEEDHPLARSLKLDRVVIVNQPATGSPAEAALAGELNLAPYACVPLHGKNRTFGVLVIDNPESQRPIAPEQLRFLELFASQAGDAMENAVLVSRLENAHRDLMETQEKLIQGERLAVLGEMSASVAHELKNPLVAIGGFAQRLSRMVANDGFQREYAEIIAREARRMEQMLSQILAFSKKQILCFGECDLNLLLDEAVEMAGDLIGRTLVRLNVEKAPDLPLIMGDQPKLRQVLINLISNACHAMADGGSLWLRSRAAFLRGEKAVEIEVEDTGGGISADVMRNIFNPFFTTKDQGTGLGLSISHRIIEHHQGEIEVFNTDCGARFTLRLPVSPNPQLEIDKPASFG